VKPEQTEEGEQLDHSPNVGTTVPDFEMRTGTKKRQADSQGEARASSVAAMAAVKPPPAGEKMRGKHWKLKKSTLAEWIVSDIPRGSVSASKSQVCAGTKKLNKMRRIHPVNGSIPLTLAAEEGAGIEIIGKNKENSSREVPGDQSSIGGITTKLWKSVGGTNKKTNINESTR
jgi:hypothetical protein